MIELAQRIPTGTASTATGTQNPRSAALRVRSIARFDALTARGGGEIQQTSTERGLGDLGIDARPWRPWEETLSPNDVVHVYGSRPEFLPLVAAAKQQGSRVALSPIAWFDWKNIWRESGSIVHRVGATTRYALRWAMPQIPSWRRRLYHAADLLLPNSQAEAEQLMRLFQIPPHKIRIVPNGVDERFAVASPKLFEAKYGLRDFVFCPGRIEPRKNQLELIQAIAGSERTLVIAGDVVPGCHDYAEACRRAAGRNVHFIGRLDHEDPLLASAYAAAACVALVGWYETPGLAALEGAATGTPLVVPRGGSAQEYFGLWAEYVSPGNVRRLRAAIETAMHRPRSPELAALVTQNFSWQRVAETTREAYDALL